MKGIEKILGIDFEKFKWEDIPLLLTNVIRLGLAVVTFLAVIYVIIGGYHYILAFGDEGRVKKGKDTITWAIIGFVVSIAAYVIVGEVWRFFSDKPLPNIANIDKLFK